MKKNARVISFVFAIGFVFALTFSAWKTSAENKQSNHADPATQFVRGRVLVKFRDHIAPDHARQIIAALGARDADEIPNLGIHILDLPFEADEGGFARAMAQRPEVEFAELDRVLSADELTPNDPWYVDQWHLKKISAPAAWSSTSGNSNVTIAILDSGVDGTHPDLVSKMVAGWNVYSNNSDTSDAGGHGTTVAGTVAAASNNSMGVASVAWGCKIMPVRIVDSSGYTSYSLVASGLTWAADHGARVANISFSPIIDSSAVTSAARYFQNKGGVVTSSAGNLGTFVSSPENSYILTVSATDTNDVLTSFSNTGNAVDLSAPGVLIRTTALGGGYQSVAGTSYSAPIVAGVAALVMSANPTLTATQVQDILKQSSDDLGVTGWDTSYGWGRVNAARAVALAGGGGTADSAAPAISITSPAGGQTVSDGITVGVSATDNVGVASVSLTIDGASQGTDSSSPYVFQWATTAATNGMHTLIATATDAAGNSASCSIIVTVSNSAPPADTTAPTETITSPATGAKMSGNASVYVNVADNVGVIRNELYVDGVLVSSSTASPFTTKWNTVKAKTGSHVLQCKAYDAAGNIGLSQTVTVYK
jgi:thermitase